MSPKWVKGFKFRYYHIILQTPFLSSKWPMGQRRLGASVTGLTTASWRRGVWCFNKGCGWRPPSPESIKEQQTITKVNINKKRRSIFVVVAKVLMSSTMLPRPRSKTESPDLLTITRYIDGMRRESVERWLVECVRACRTHPERRRCGHLWQERYTDCEIGFFFPHSLPVDM